MTWGHLPEWLNTNHPKLHIVKHEDYIPEKFLPTFSSHVIELNLHRIKGLSEQFVYFNDDMFLTAPVKQTDFFKDGLPCDSALLNPIAMTRRVDHAEINNIGILNDHFEKNRVIAEHPWKWYNLKYGKFLVRNFLLMPWKHFIGLYEPHLASCFLKRTLEEVWREEGEELTRTCSYRFRDSTNVNQWLFRDWQLAKGDFVPRDMKFGKMFTYGENGNYDEVCDAVRNGKWKMVCINDFEVDDFQARKEKLQNAFE